ncbi:MAG: hypothetical protein QG596_771 [Actinomycetota bacterium]|jgi:AcrR family transcriptional regulator|nr:hypothetical protein [Actinomycetota bacterium]
MTARTTSEVREVEGGTPRRADAVRNRERVITAAEEVFAEQGIDAGIPVVADRAGVGKGTVYRNFETKDDLVASVLSLRLARMDEDIVAALEEEDPGEAMRDVLKAAAARTSALSFPPGVYLPGRHAELDQVKDRVKMRMAKLFRAAQKAGEVRPDAKVDELFVLFGGTCRALADSGQKNPKVWRRHADLVVDAFRP